MSDISTEAKLVIAEGQLQMWQNTLWLNEQQLKGEKRVSVILGGPGKVEDIEKDLKKSVAMISYWEEVIVELSSTKTVEVPK